MYLSVFGFGLLGSVPHNIEVFVLFDVNVRRVFWVAFFCDRHYYSIVSCSCETHSECEGVYACT